MKRITKKYTIDDIAALGGVSRGTVSRVINNSSSVNRKTRENILRIIKQAHYVPDPYARALITKKTGLLGLFIPDITNLFFADVIRGIQMTADEYGYDLILCNTESDYQKEQEALKRLLMRKVEGFVISSTELGNREEGKLLLRHLIEKGQKMVFISSTKDIPADHVVVDNEKGGYLATRHLIELGHRTIAHISGFLKTTSGHERFMGYRKAMEEANIPFNENFIADGEFTFQGGYRAAKKMLGQKELPSAIFAANDIMALGGLQAINENGKKIPEDMALVGFDDIPVSALVKPALSTIHQPSLELGRKSAEILIGRIRDELPGKRVEITIEPKLVVRDSSAVFRSRDTFDK